MLVANSRLSEATTGRVALSIGQRQIGRLGNLDDVAKMLVVLNLLDAVFTLYWIQAGLAVELNALMRDLVVENALGFVLVKLALVSLGSYWLLLYRGHRFAVAGLTVSLLVYLGVLLHHLRFSGLLLLASM